MALAGHSIGVAPVFHINSLLLILAVLLTRVPLCSL